MFANYRRFGSIFFSADGIHAATARRRESTSFVRAVDGGCLGMIIDSEEEEERKVEII